MAEKFLTKTKPAIAKNASAASYLTLRGLMQVDEMFQNKKLALKLARVLRLHPYLPKKVLVTKRQRGTLNRRKGVIVTS